MGETAIRLCSVGKLFRIGAAQERHRSLPEAIARSLSAPLRGLLRRRDDAAELLWALQDVSFEVPRGQVLGIVGHNGAGKSTLLKILSRITEPTCGEIEIRGRVASLLEVGTGFHPELTGRENIYLNGAILGMRRREIERKFDRIVAFAEIDRFLDTPVKRYSSGMYVRLAFAVAAHLEPEILLVDEVLAVGDAAFQKKCLGQMGEVAREGRTVLFVSHQLSAVAALCHRALLMERGRVVVDAPASETIRRYLSGLTDRAESADGVYHFPVETDRPAQFLRVRLVDEQGRPCLRPDVLQPFRIEIDFELRATYPTLHLQCHFHRADGGGAFGSIDSDHANWRRQAEGLPMEDVFPRPAGRYRATVHVPAPFLNSGAWEAELLLTTGPSRQDTQRVAFEVGEEMSFASFVHKGARGGVVVTPLRWQVERLEREQPVADAPGPETALAPEGAVS